MIPIRNIYYMLSYAFQTLREDAYAQMASEEFSGAGDLLAAILAQGVSRQLKRGLSREYIAHEEALAVPVGKIDIAGSIKRMTMLQHRLQCNFELYTENAYANRILKTTMRLLLRCPYVEKFRRQALRGLLCFFSDVVTVNPREIRWSSVRYHRNNAEYRMLLYICRLVLEGLLQHDLESGQKLSRYLDDQHMHALYERFVLQYYRRHYPWLRPEAAYIQWDLDDGIASLLPVMRSDITLSDGIRTLIIDTKYYSHTMQHNSLYDTTTLHSGNLYQIYTYVKNRDAGHTGLVSGVLLYAKTDEAVTPDNEYRMGGNRIAVKALDLDREFKEIKAQLDSIVAWHFGAA